MSEEDLLISPPFCMRSPQCFSSLSSRSNRLLCIKLNIEFVVLEVYLYWFHKYSSVTISMSVKITARILKFLFNISSIH